MNAHLIRSGVAFPSILIGAAMLILTAASGNAADSGKSIIEIGSKIPDLRFRDIRTLPRSLSEMGTHKAWVLVFTTTHCPLVRQTFPKLVELHRNFKDKDVQFICVNVGVDDSIREMAAQAIDYDVPFAFVKDVDHSCVVALGVERTPEVVVLDQELRIQYRGRVDDQLRLSGSRPEPTRRDLEEALNEILAGQSVSKPETPVDGCTITLLSTLESELPSPKFYGEVDSILFGHCVNCHRPESSAPFSMLNVEDATANAQMIAEVVRNESMPPWYASSNHGKFQNDPSLTRKERSTLLRWVETGCAAGKITSASPVPKPPSGKWRIGEPDLVITMLEQHSIPATGFVDYRYAVLPHLFLNETWVEAFEIKPDNRSVVHHCNMAYATASGGASEETFITGYVPGGQPLDLGRFDNGVAYRIPKGSGLGLQIHYTTTGKEEKCRIQVGLRYPRNKVNKQFRHFLLDPRGFNITPNDPAYEIRSSRTLAQDSTLLGLFTHMHVRGRDMTFFAITPDSKRETLLQIPNYNFEWQLGYEIEPGARRLSKGDVVEAVAHFDNSAFNPYNPDHNKTVRYGPQTVDEMFNGFVFFVADEEQLNLTIDPASGHVK